MSDGILYVLFTTGHVEMVSEAIKSRKENKTGFLPALSFIRHAELIKGTKALILVVESEVRAIVNFVLKFRWSSHILSCCYTQRLTFLLSVMSLIFMDPSVIVSNINTQNSHISM